MNAIVRARIATQGISRPSKVAPVEIVRRLLAVQSQDYIGAKWAIGLRIAGATDAAIDRAVNEPLIVRTHVLRPTWHFVAAEDIRWLLALTGPRVLSLNSSMANKLGLGAATMAKAHAAIARALEGGKALTRDELKQHIVRAGVKVPTGQHLAYIVMHAEQTALICNGARRGKQFTYALMEERIAPTPAIERDEALGRLAARYIAGHGPATLHDLARWGSLTVKDCTRAFEIAGAAVRPKEIDGRVHYVSPKAPTPHRGPIGAQLLCIYDEYFAGYKERGALITPADEKTITSRGAEVREGFTIDGRVRGTWARTFSAKEASIEIRPFGKLTTAEQKLVRAAAEPYATFFGLRPRVTFKR